VRILLVSSYHGGSHQKWAEGYAKYSRHEIVALTLPARYWKWRMHGGSVTLARKFKAVPSPPPDLIVATDMVDLSTFLALTRCQVSGIPAVLYMHENQLTYPLPDDPAKGGMRRQLGERDAHYAFINYVSMLAADRVVFNSEFHLNSFLDALPNFLKRFPEKREISTVNRIREKSTVLPVGIDLDAYGLDPRKGKNRRPLVLWNQRWEYDKNPEEFFAVLRKIAAEGIDFEVAICGQSFQRQPEEFKSSIEALGARVIHLGYAPFPEYVRILWEADITLSTAYHEFFGVSLVEAILCKTFPVLPARLSYPEIIPEAFHNMCLYRSHEELLNRLRWALNTPDATAAVTESLSHSLHFLDWKDISLQYDTLFEHLMADRGSGSSETR
jgi:glycosyltransferase involved in cell wall biosynthesis